MRYAVLVAALAAAAGSTHTLGQFSGFERIETPGTVLRSITPTDLNSDGTVVVGYGYTFDFSGYRPIRRLGGGAVEELGLYPGETRARSYAVNADGAFIVGGGDSEGFWWVPPGPNIGSASPPLLDVNDDGSVFISETIRYAGLDSPADFPNIPSYTSLKAVRMDASGNSVALSCKFFQPGNGYGYPPEPSITINQAARWTPEGGTQGIGFLPSGNESFAVGISADGAVVVGRGNVQTSPGTFVSRPFRWSAAQGMQPIPMLNADPSGFGEATDASADGSVVVGSANGRAFIWDAVHGTRDLKTVIQENGHDTTGWTLHSAVAISDDGLVVAGIGTIDGSFANEGWIANLAITCTVPDSVGSVSLGVVAREDAVAPGASNVFGSSFTPNDLKSDGTVAFDASLANGLRVCYTGVPGSLSLIAIANGAPYIQPSLARLTSSNQAALRDVRSFFPGPESKYVYNSGPVNALSVLAQPGTAAPQSGGGTFDPFTANSSELFLNNSDLFAFQSQITGGTTGVAAYATVGGTLTRSFVALPGGATSLANPRLTALTDSGALVRRGNIDTAGGAEVLLLGGPPPATSSLIAQTGTQAPGEAVGVNYFDLLDSAADTNTLAFFASLSNGNTALFKGTTSGVQSIARIGSTVDGLPARTIQGFSPSKGFAILPDGDTLFVATLSEGDSSSVALVRSSASGLRSLVLQGDTKLPGYDVCRTVRDLSLIAADGDRALISATPALAAETGIYLLSSQGLTMLAQVGQSIELAPELTGQITQVQSPGASAAARTGRDGRGTFLLGNAATFTATVNTSGGLKRALLRAAFSLPSACPCDLNGDGVVDDADFTLFIPAYNMLDCADPAMPPGCPADFNHDGVVEDSDFTIFVVAYNELLCP